MIKDILPLLAENSADDSEKERISIMLSKENLDSIIEFNIIQKALLSSARDFQYIEETNKIKTNISGAINDVLSYIFKNNFLEIQKGYQVYDFEALQVTIRESIRKDIVDSLYKRRFNRRLNISEESEESQEYLEYLLKPITDIKDDPDNTELLERCFASSDNNIYKFISSCIQRDKPGLSYDEIAADVGEVFNQKRKIREKLLELRDGEE